MKCSKVLLSKMRYYGEVVNGEESIYICQFCSHLAPKHPKTDKPGPIERTRNHTKGPRKNKFAFWGVEAPVWQGARSE